jgi:hypothetical protein
MLSCVETDASRDSGAGETVTREPASAAETFRRDGVQRGETLGSTNLLADALGSAPAALAHAPTRSSATTAAGSATVATAASSAGVAPVRAPRGGARRALTP